MRSPRPTSTSCASRAALGCLRSRCGRGSRRSDPRQGHQVADRIGWKTQICGPLRGRDNRRCAMSQFEIADNKFAADTERAASAYVPALQRTEGQPPPIAAHGGLSYMSFDRDGDAGTAVALEDALTEIAEGENQRVIDMIGKAPPGPIKTQWGLGFRDYDECLNYIRQSNSIKAPAGGVALPLPYTVYERPSYSVVPSNALWQDPARADMAAILRTNERGNRRRDLYFPQVLRDARRIGEYYPGLSPNRPECM